MAACGVAMPRLGTVNVSPPRGGGGQPGVGGDVSGMTWLSWTGESIASEGITRRVARTSLLTAAVSGDGAGASVGSAGAVLSRVGEADGVDSADAAIVSAGAAVGCVGVTAIVGAGVDVAGVGVLSPGVVEPQARTSTSR